MQVTVWVLVTLIVVFGIDWSNARCNNGKERCEWSNWDSWGSCYPTCGGGTRRRGRGMCCSPGYKGEWYACLDFCGKHNDEAWESGPCNEHCVNGGTYYSNRCNCPPEHSGYCCGQDTCSWKKYPCWPGRCSNPTYPGTCDCEIGFKETSTGVCDISTKADLLFCKLTVADKRGELRQTQSGDNTGCSYERDTFINIIPTSLSFNIHSHFERKGMTSEPDYIRHETTKIGIVSGLVDITEQDLTGGSSSLNSAGLKGGGHCDQTMGPQTPATLLECQNNLTFTANLQNGHRICTDIDVSAGGSFVYTDFGGNYKGSTTFTPLLEKKTLCFKYDNVPPAHCAATAPCGNQPLTLSTRIPKTGSVIINVSGWSDPTPQPGIPDQASQIDFYMIEVYKMKHLGLDRLDVDYGSNIFKSENIINSPISIPVDLPDQPMMYAVYLEVHDIAGNVQFARRFLLYDDNSTVEVRGDKQLLPVSASSKTQYKWQIHHGDIRLDWTDRYHNDYYINNNYLAPIVHDVNNIITGIYDQIDGVLPVAGTPSVNGITSFKYRWSLDNGTRTPWSEVPDFLNQSRSLPLSVEDGETYEIWIMAEDIMLNKLVESVVIHIDRSVANIADTWLVRDGTSQIYVHNNTDLSKMVIQFRAFDVHSGITSVQWALGTSNAGSDLGTGALPVVKLSEGDNCSQGSDCYCPSVGPCEYQNYTLTLNSLVANNTHTGQHHREYYFTFTVTNDALLKSVGHLDILVDESAPETGVVQEGTQGGQDIDYTSEDHVIVSWKGFIDHESGIRNYVVGLGKTCLSPEELLTGNITNATIHVTTADSTSFHFPSEGKFYVSMIANNNALEPSDVICSDGITFDLTPPIIRDISLHGASLSPSIYCIDSQVWLVNDNLTMTVLPTTDKCLNQCQLNAATPSRNIRLPIAETGNYDNDTADSFCKNFNYLHKNVIYTPFNKLTVNWSISEDSSQIKDSFVGFGSDSSSLNSPDLGSYISTHGKSELRYFRTGFGGSTEFFVFIKLENKAGLSTISTLGPVMIDDTPPLVHGTLVPEIVGDHVRVAWNRGAFSDPEQLDDMFKVTFRAVMSDVYITPMLQTAESLRLACKAEGFLDCLQYALSVLQRHDSELGNPCLFEMYVYNQAGHFTTVRTESFQLPSMFPPGPATVLDLNPRDLDNLVDVDFQQNHTACVHWYGFHHHMNVSFEIGIGMEQNKDDVESFQQFWIDDSLTTCIQSHKLTPFTQYYTSIRASCSGGSSVSSSDGFVIVDEEPGALTVNDGLGCNPIDKFLISQIRTTKDSHMSIETPLHVGLLYTMVIEDSADLESEDMVIENTEVVDSTTWITFFPLSSNPVFNLVHVNQSESTIHLYSCVANQDVQQSTTEFSINWHYESLQIQFMTHFKLSLFEEVCADLDDNSCTILIKDKTVQGVKYSLFTFTNLALDSGLRYRALVQPCFGSICLAGTFSDGATVARQPAIGNLRSMIEEEIECTRISLDVSNIQCNDGRENQTYPIQWTVVDQEHGGPLVPWMLMHNHTMHKQSYCIELPVHSYQSLLTCVRVFCHSGLLAKRCSQLGVNPYAQSYSKHTLFEFPADDARLSGVEDMLHSKHIGSRLKALHEIELDFATRSSRISAIVTNSAGRDITWYMMKAKQTTPDTDCESDPSCVASKFTSGLVRFGKVSLEESETYYVCANVSSRGETPGFVVCGNGFIVDETPPLAGSVSITNTASGFLTDASHLHITWSGFRDVIPDRARGYVGGIKAFSVAIGTYPGGTSIMPWTRVGDHTSFMAQGLSIKNAEEYFVTVKAEDHVGLMTEVVSPGVTADLTPPVCGDIRVEGLLPHRTSLAAESLHIHLGNFHDPESQLRPLHLSILSSGGDGTSLEVEPGTDFVDVGTEGVFRDGHVYHVKVQMTNGAGLVSSCEYRSFLFDNSSPQVGVVRDGNVDEETDYQTDTNHLKCHWSGFSDTHSGIREYRVGLGRNGLDDDQPLHSISKAQNFTWLGNFIPGVKHHCSVEACNGAGLCTSVTSDGIIMDGSPPVAGVVIVGHTDTQEKYHGHRSYVYSHWVGFEDAETGIHHFECCIGLNSNSCDIVNFTNTALSDSYLAIGLNLPLSVPLYVTVRAYNPVGLFVESTSPSFTVDDTPPEVIRPPVFVSTTSDGRENITSQWENSLLYVKWEFSDDESPVHEHVIFFKTHHESSVAIETIKLGPQQSHLLVLDKDNRLQNGDRYQVSVSCCNRAGLCTTAHSPDILIDSTPPILGGFKPPMTWENSNGSMNSSVNITWYGFSDSESGIDHYMISVGRTYEGAELTEGNIVVGHVEGESQQETSITLSEQLNPGDNIVLNIWATNSVGLTSSIGKVTVTVLSTKHGDNQGVLEIQRHSCDIHYCTKDCTCAVVGWKCRPPPLPLVCNDVTNSSSQLDIVVHTGTRNQQHVSSTASISCLAGHWGMIGGSGEGILRYEWSMGIAGENPGVGIFNMTVEQLWYDVGTMRAIVHCLPYDRALEHGEDYVVYVKSWYSSTDFKISTSPNIRVDHTPPAVRRGKLLMDSDQGCGNDYDIFHVNQSAVTACWDSLYQESQTSVKEFIVWAGTTHFGTDIIDMVNVGLSSNISLPVEDLKPGTKYYVGVCAVNTLNMSTTVISDGFLLDADTPRGGHVFNSETHKNILAQSDNTSIGVSWNGFQDHHSSVLTYRVQIYEINVTDAMSEVTVSLRNSIVVSNLTLQQGSTYVASVTAQDFAGHVSEDVCSQSVIVDTSPPIGFTCEAFEKINPDEVTYENETISTIVTHRFVVGLPLYQHDFFRIKLSTVGDRLENEHVLFIVDHLHTEVPFTRRNNNTLYAAEYEFLIPTGKTYKKTTIEVLFQGRVQTMPNITVEACTNKIDTSGAAVITTKQILPSLLAICARVMDRESGLKNILIGVGTTPGGYQVQTLRPTVARFHELLEVNLPHGTPVYTTIIAENHAGLKSLFSGNPITIDHTPPLIRIIKATVLYTEDHGHTHVLATWTIEEDESEVANCWCSLGHGRLTSDIHDWEPSPNTTSCQLPVLSVYHGLRLYMTVQCSNTAEMHSQASSEKLQVMLSPPSTNNARVDVVVQNAYSQHGHEAVQSTTSSLKFQWTWSDDDTVSHYQCRVDGLQMTDWVNTSLRYCEFLDLNLTDARDYTTQIRAVDGREQMSDVVSAKVHVDSSNPKLTGTRARVQTEGGAAIIDYSKVFYHVSGRLTYTVSVGSRRGYSDYLHLMTTQLQHVTVELPVATSEIHVAIVAKAPVGTRVTYTDVIRV